MVDFDTLLNSSKKIGKKKIIPTDCYMIIWVKISIFSFQLKIFYMKLDYKKEKKRVKSILTLYIENLNNIISTRSDWIFRLEQIHNKKDFIIPYKSPLWKTSENLKSFLTHRKTIDSRTKIQFNPENKIPFVLRFHHLNKKNKDFFNNLDDVMKFHNTISMGCHNIADRISVKNPKTIKSVRTFFTFPHYGKNNEIKEITKGSSYFTNKRVVDTNGNLWISHSINAIKNGSEFYQKFGEDSIDEIPFTENKEYTKTTFDLIGNDVLFDMDISEEYPMKGLYTTFNYIKRDEFDFGDFNEEELYEVERWLDFEWMSLILMGNHAFPKFQSKDGLNEETMNNMYVEILEELQEERGSKFIIPMLASNLIGTANQLIEQSSRSSAVELMKKVLQSQGEEESEETFEKWLKVVEEKIEGKLYDFNWNEDNLEIDEENGWFFPLNPEYTSPEDFRKSFFSSWINRAKQSLENGSYTRF